MAVHKILIVEDQRELARAIQSGLAAMRHDFQVSNVPSGEEALLLVNRQPPDLVLIDIKLPGISGLELMERIRQRHPDVKVIFITGLTDPDTRERVAQAGADAFLYKPFDLPDILRGVEDVLGLAPQPLPESAIEPTAPSLSDRLAALRQELGAVTAVVLDDRGKLLVQAGELPSDAHDSGLIPALMAVFSASARIAHLLQHSPPRSQHHFPGTDFDLHLAPLGGSHSLLVATPGADSPAAVGAQARAVRAAANELCRILEILGVPLADEEERPLPEPILEEAAVGPEDAPQDFESVLERVDSEDLSPEEVRAFWDQEDQEVDTGGLSADSLTYDQARKLGLTPNDE